MTKKVEIIDKKKFTAAVLNVDNKIFVLHKVALAEPILMPIHPSCQAQDTLLTSEETKILAKYSNFSNVFSSDSAAELLKQTKINDYPINLLDNKQSFYGPIYSLGPVELEMLKTYIEANLVSSFIRLFKSFANALILFVQKKDNSLRLCIDY